MDEVKEMIRGVINGQHALRRELLGEISQLRKEFNNLSTETMKGFAEVNERLATVDRRLSTVDKRLTTVDKRLTTVDKRLTVLDIRLDKQGAQLAFLEDDAPTREEHDKLEKRVGKIERRVKN